MALPTPIQRNGLQRFINAQDGIYNNALSEIKNGKKQSHWMWFIFPQIQGLGFSEISKLYAIRDLQEAEAFMSHPILGNRLIVICEALMQNKTKDANIIFGNPDDRKLLSCMTLFSCLKHPHPLFEKVIKTFFEGVKDIKTLRILKKI